VSIARAQPCLLKSREQSVSKRDFGAPPSKQTTDQGLNLTLVQIMNMRIKISLLALRYLQLFTHLRLV